MFFSLQFSSVAQSCPTLWDPMNHSRPGLPVHHRSLPKLMSIESVMPSNHLILCGKSAEVIITSSATELGECSPAVMFSQTLFRSSACSVMSDSFVTPRIVARQVPLSLEFSRQDYWSG